MESGPLRTFTLVFIVSIIWSFATTSRSDDECEISAILEALNAQSTRQNENSGVHRAAESARSYREDTATLLDRAEQVAQPRVSQNGSPARQPTEVLNIRGASRIVPRAIDPVPSQTYVPSEPPSRAAAYNRAQRTLESGVIGFAPSVRQRMNAVVRNVLNRWRSNGLEPPELQYDVTGAEESSFLTQQGGYAAWEWRVRDHFHDCPRWQVDQNSDATWHRASEGVSSAVFRIVHDGRTYYFRPLTRENQAAFRKTLLASLIAERMNFHSGNSPAPHSRVVEINGQLGVVSEVSPGQPASTRGFRSAEVEAAELARARSLSNPQSLSVAEGFAFLLSNGDTHTRNFNITRQSMQTNTGQIVPQGNIQIFDWDKALTTGLSPNQAIGESLPNQYSTMLRRALRTIDNTYLNQDPELLLLTSDRERRRIMFGRDLMIDDMIMNGRADTNGFIEVPAASNGGSNSH